MPILAAGPSVWNALEKMVDEMRLVKLDVQPEVTKFRADADGIEVWYTLIHKAGTLVPQHAHKFPHLTIVSHGAVLVTLNGTLIGKFEAPNAIYIPARTMHLFETLADGTVLECIHNVSRRGNVELHAENPGVV